MKTLFIAFIMLASSASFASGFQCSGMGYKAMLYNQVQPSQGTSNPAVLILSYDEKGTLVKLDGSDIEKQFTQEAYMYAGATALQDSGEPATVSFSVSKTLEDSGQRYAEFTVTTSKYAYTVKLDCDDYRKNNPQE